MAPDDQLASKRGCQNRSHGNNPNFHDISKALRPACGVFNMNSFFGCIVIKDPESSKYSLYKGKNY